MTWIRPQKPGRGKKLRTQIEAFEPRHKARLAAEAMLEAAGRGRDGLVAIFPVDAFFGAGNGIPRAAHERIAALMEKASVPSAFGLGALVGLCEFPCTGGPYLMVLGLLRDQNSVLATLRSSGATMPVLVDEGDILYGALGLSLIRGRSSWGRIAGWRPSSPCALSTTARSSRRAAPCAGRDSRRGNAASTRARKAAPFGDTQAALRYRALAEGLESHASA